MTHEEYTSQSVLGAHAVCSAVQRAEVQPEQSSGTALSVSTTGPDASTTPASNVVGAHDATLHCVLHDAHAVC